MSLALTILGIVGTLVPFVVMLIKNQMEKRKHADTAIGKRDRDDLRSGLSKLRGEAESLPAGSQTKL